MNDFYEEPRQLNMKKVIGISAIFVIIIILLIVFIAKKISTPEEVQNVETTDSTTIFYSDDKSISVELSNSFNLKTYDSDLGYLLELRSEDDLNIFISKEDALQNRTLSEVADADKLAYLNNFESYSNLSEIKELAVNDNPAYTYSFHYLDKNLNTAFCIQVIWLQVDDNYYTFDIEFPLDDLSFNTNIVSTLLSSFKINN